MMGLPEGNAIVYCDGAFNTSNGKTAHGLVRFTRRYRVLSVVDGSYSGRDAGEVLDGNPKGIPILPTIEDAFNGSRAVGGEASHLVIGIAPDGGRLSETARRDVMGGLEMGLNVDSGLHDFLSDDPEMVSLAAKMGAKIRDLRKPPDRRDLHFFTGKIEEVDAFKIAVLGTDSAVGKRTTAWLLVDALSDAGHRAEMVGTGQTAWMQGAKYCIVLDSLINDFVSGEIEHAVWSAWNDSSPEAIVIEGQGSLMNPAYPGGFEILAAARPDAVLLQHAPARVDYDGFPGHRIHPLGKQIEAIELISGVPVVAVTINHEGIAREEIPSVCKSVSDATGLPALDALSEGAKSLAEVIVSQLKKSAR